MTADADNIRGSKPASFLRRHRGKLLLLLAVPCLLVAAPFLMFFGSIAVDELVERANRLSFDSTAWRKSLESDTSEPTRLRMVDDLLRRHRVVGMNRQEVVSLLGSPPKTGYFSDYDVVYWLGPERGFMSIDSEWLAIRLDSNDHVIEARIVRD